MYLWRKLADRSWLSIHEEALRSVAGNQLAIIDRVDRKRLQLEIASNSRRELEKVAKQFGGRIEKLPRDWLKRLTRQHKTKPVKIAGKRLAIPAGAAFGTGEHATTAMCLHRLATVMRCWGARAPRPLFSAPSPKSLSKGSLVIAVAKCTAGVRRGRRTQRAGRTRSPELVVDLGTGSGILALAARRLGAKRVIGIDLDPLAISIAKQNARRNKIDNVQFRLADVRRWKLPRKVDIVTANLFSGLIVEILPKLRRVPCLVLSGMLRDQEAEVARALQRNRIEIVEVRRRGKWLAIVAKASGEAVSFFPATQPRAHPRRAP
jgi:ribosomal protein L11 methyltransferase